MKRIMNVATTLIVLSTIGTVSAFAANRKDNDALLTHHANISLSQAAEIAEQQVHGKANRAELEHGKHGWVYDVEVVADAKVYDVAIDATKGILLNSSVDAVDHDDEHDQED